MLVVISPAKRLTWEGARAGETEPAFLVDANRLAGHARQLTIAALGDLMGLSDDLARLNYRRFRAFSDAPNVGVTRAAAFAFAGDTFLGLEAQSLDEDALRHAQERLRILSELYGLLRPLDAIQAHRLEMGTRLRTRRGAMLYAFWGTRIAEAPNAAAAGAGNGWLLNCASRGYFGPVPQEALRLRVVTPVFLEEKDGEARIVSVLAKRARGAMARFVMERRLTEPEALADFDTGGYRFDPDRSAADRPVFVRPHAVPARSAA